MPDRDDPAEPVGGGDPLSRPAPRAEAAKADQARADAAEDAELVRRARTGDERAFGALVRKHVRAAHAAALVVLDDAAEAEDAVQDAFVAALRRLEDCRPEEKFRPWLLTIVRNRAIDMRRRQRVRRADSLDVVGETVAAPAGLGPLRDAERADVRAHLERALATLTTYGGRWCCCTTSRGGVTARSASIWVWRKGRSGHTCSGRVATCDAG